MSGIVSADDCARSRDSRADAALIGEALMRAPDPGARLREWLEALRAERARCALHARRAAVAGCSAGRGALALARGKVTMKVAPWFCSLWISIVPPCASTIWRTSARPMPAPCVRSE